MAKYTVGDHLLRLHDLIADQGIPLIGVEEEDGVYSANYAPEATPSQIIAGNEIVASFDDSDEAHDEWLAVNKQTELAFAPFNENPIQWAVARVLHEYDVAIVGMLNTINDTIKFHHGSDVVFPNDPDWPNLVAQVQENTINIQNFEIS